MKPASQAACFADEKAEQDALRLIDEASAVGYISATSKFNGDGYKRVTTSDSIEVGEVEGSQWVSVLGKGSFSSSPRLKEYLDQKLEGGANDVVVDLNGCSAMDSTFMGTLAGFALTLAQREGHMMVVGLSERNRDSLVDLGLAELIELEGEGGNSKWSSRLNEIREDLKPWQGNRKGAAVAEEVLAAHQKLCDANENNAAKFEAVIEVLEEQCSVESAR